MECEDNVVDSWCYHDILGLRPWKTSTIATSIGDKGFSGALDIVPWFLGDTISCGGSLGVVNLKSCVRGGKNPSFEEGEAIRSLSFGLNVSHG